MPFGSWCSVHTAFLGCSARSSFPLLFRISVFTRTSRKRLKFQRMCVLQTPPNRRYWFTFTCPCSKYVAAQQSITLILLKVCEFFLRFFTFQRASSVWHKVLNFWNFWFPYKPHVSHLLKATLLDFARSGAPQSDLYESSVRLRHLLIYYRFLKNSIPL